MKRRKFLAGTTISLAALGGCVGGSSSGSESSPTDSGTAEPTSTETTQTTTESPTTQTETESKSPTTETETATESPTKESETATKSPTTQTETDTELPTSTTTSIQQANGECRNVTYAEFYALSASVADDVWGPSTANVGLSLGAGANIHLVALEGGRVLGRTQVEAPDDGAVVVDGQAIPLDTELSGEHMIRVVVYPNTGKGDQFDTEQATPCQREGEPVQTDARTIDFSRFSKNTTTATTETTR